MADYRRVTVPQFLFATVQVLLVWGAILCLATPTDVTFLPPCGLSPIGSGTSTAYGYPTPWLETREQSELILRSTPEGHEYIGMRQKGTERVGWNLAVPVATLVLVAVGPVALVGSVGHLLTRRREPVTRRARLLLVLFTAALAGVGVSLLDVLTDTGIWSPVGQVPFLHPPGSWVDELVTPVPLEWLRDRRHAILPQSGENLVYTESIRREWTARAGRTTAAMAFAAVLATAVIRPWRRQHGVNGPLPQVPMAGQTV